MLTKKLDARCARAANLKPQEPAVSGICNWDFAGQFCNCQADTGTIRHVPVPVHWNIETCAIETIEAFMVFELPFRYDLKNHLSLPYLGGFVVEMVSLKDIESRNDLAFLGIKQSTDLAPRLAQR